MGVLTGPEIERVQAGFYDEDRRRIVIDPPSPHVGPNSADLTLGNVLRYVLPGPDGVLDTRGTPATRDYPIPSEGVVLPPGAFVLGTTVERTATEGLMPWIDGRSTTGRFGLMVHVTAGKGDDGFGAGPDGPRPWTLEIVNVSGHPLRIYAGRRIAQVFFFTLVGERRPYAGAYNAQDGPTPPQPGGIG